MFYNVSILQNVFTNKPNNTVRKANLNYGSDSCKIRFKGNEPVDRPVKNEAVDKAKNRLWAEYLIHLDKITKLADERIAKSIKSGEFVPDDKVLPFEDFDIRKIYAEFPDKDLKWSKKGNPEAKNRYMNLFRRLNETIKLLPNTPMSLDKKLWNFEFLASEMASTIVGMAGCYRAKLDEGPEYYEKKWDAEGFARKLLIPKTMSEKLDDIKEITGSESFEELMKDESYLTRNEKRPDVDVNIPVFNNIEELESNTEQLSKNIAEISEKPDDKLKHGNIKLKSTKAYKEDLISNKIFIQKALNTLEKINEFDFKNESEYKTARENFDKVSNYLVKAVDNLERCYSGAINQNKLSKGQRKKCSEYAKLSIKLYRWLKDTVPSNC